MDAFIARQPIFDRMLKVRAYELLFRSGIENGFDDTDPDEATSRVIADTLFLPGLSTLSGGQPAFINITRELLVRDWVSLLPPATTVLEILETIEPDDELLEACRRLKRQGYRLALDDYRLDPRWNKMLGVVDIVKVDTLVTPHAEREALARQLLPTGITLLAEKVETIEVFAETQELGYRLFQGYFFARPLVVTSRDIPASKLSYLQILREIHRPELDFDTIEEVIQREVALSYKLLRYINASFYGWSGTVGSLHHALFLLGECEIRKWASVIALAGMASDKPGELVTQALIRARFCELIAPAAGLSLRASDLFLMGLFSLIDAILDLPLESILSQIPIADDVRAALLGKRGPLRDVFDVAVAYMAGDWPALPKPIDRLNLDECALPVRLIEAVQWCSGAMPHSGWAQAA